MARNKKPKAEAEFLFYDVVYEDGTRRSNRRVASAEMAELEDDDEPARTIIEAQDRQLSEVSGKPRAAIASVTRSRN